MREPDFEAVLPMDSRALAWVNVGDQAVAALMATFGFEPTEAERAALRENVVPPGGRAHRCAGRTDR